MSSTFLQLHRYREALDALEKARELCDTSWVMDLSGIELGCYRVYKAMEDHAKALDHFEAYIRLRDRINREESARQVAELLARFETEKKEQQIHMLEQDNLLNKNMIRTQWQLIGILVLMGLFLFTAGLWWIRGKNQALKRMKMELQHFLLSQEREEDKKSTNSRISVSEPEPAQAYSQWGLTPRESEILYYLGLGCSNAGIAGRLFITENTVKFHMKNIYVKLDVKNRTQAILRCSENNHAGSENSYSFKPDNPANRENNQSGNEKNFTGNERKRAGNL